MNHLRIFRSFWVLCLCFGVVSLAFAAGAFKKKTPETQIQTQEAPKPGPTHVPHQLLIAFKSPLSKTERAALFKKYQLTEVERVGSTDLFLTQLPEGSKDELLDKTMTQISLEPAVKYAEKNMILRTFKDGTQGGFSVQGSD